MRKLCAVSGPTIPKPTSVARFEAHDRFAYQAIVTGPEKVISRDNIDTFMTSFKVPR